MTATTDRTIDAGDGTTLRVRTDSAGRSSGAFRVRPPRAGWREWTVQAGPASARTGAWVDSAGAPRVLVRAGQQVERGDVDVLAFDVQLVGAGHDTVENLARRVLCHVASVSGPDLITNRSDGKYGIQPTAQERR